MKTIQLCPDGKYRWAYELSLYKNPHLLFLIWKIMGGVVAGVSLFLMIVQLFSGNTSFEELIVFPLQLFFGIGALMFVLGAIGYFVYALIMGGKYCVIFEMDENGVNHKQTADQAKKARKISKATTGAGLATGRLTTIGIGINSARTEMYSDFERVRKIKAYPKTNVIKVNGRLSRNQVYAEKEDFDFVKNYIVEHCKNAKPQKTYGKMT